MGKVDPTTQIIVKPKKKTSKSTDETKLDRSKNEKERRDAINALINALSDLIPFINRNSVFTGKKLETSIEDKLRMSKSFYELISNDGFIAHLKEPKQQTNYLLDIFYKNRCALLNESFFLCDGFTRFLTVHDEVFADLGYLQSDLIGRKLTDVLVPQEDRKEFEANLDKIKREFWSKIGTVPKAKRMEQRRDFSFTCRLQHNQKSGVTKIVNQNQPLLKISTVTLTGSFILLKQRPIIQYKREIKGNKHIHLKRINDIYLTDTQLGIVGQIKIESDEKQIFRHSIFTTEWNQYTIYCDPFGKILWADHRISLILGHTPSEVKGVMAHDFILSEDTRIALFNHRELMIKRVGEQKAMYRLLAKNKGIVYTQSFGSVYAAACINDRFNLPVFKIQVVEICEEEGEQLLAEERARIIPLLGNATKDELIREVGEAIKGLDRSTVDCDFDSLPIEPANTSTSSYLSDNYSETSNDIVRQSSTQKSPVEQTISLTSTQQPMKSHNLNHDQPVQSLFYQCFPVIGSDQQMFAPLFLSSTQSSPRQLLNTTQSPDDHLFIQNININNIIMLGNQNQQHWDQQLPAEAEGAFVNLSPFLE